MVIAKVDSGDTNHYCRKQDITCLQLFQRVIGPEITLPKNSVIRSNQQGYTYQYAKKIIRGTKTIVVTYLKSSSLVSLGQRCDDNCKVLLDKISLYVVKDKELILKGHHNRDDDLWDIPLHNQKVLDTQIELPAIHTVLRKK